MQNSRRWSQAIVTGATSGIGLAIARSLAAEGTALTLVARTASRLEEVAAELAASPSVAVDTLAADLSTMEGIDRVAQRVSGSGPAVDLLVNNAAGGAAGALADRASVADEVTLGVTAVAVLTHRAVQAMTARGSGTVLNVASGTAFYPIPLAATYGASKSFVLSFGEAVDYELRGTDVNVTTVCPGFTATGAAERAGGDISTIPAVLRMTPDAVAAHALAAARAGRRVAHPGRLNRTGAMVGRHLPHALVLPAIAAQQRRLRPVRAGAVPTGRDGRPA